MNHGAFPWGEFHFVTAQQRNRSYSSRTQETPHVAVLSAAWVPSGAQATSPRPGAASDRRVRVGFDLDVQALVVSRKIRRVGGRGFVPDRKKNSVPPPTGVAVAGVVGGTTTSSPRTATGEVAEDGDVDVLETQSFSFLENQDRKETRGESTRLVR